MPVYLNPEFGYGKNCVNKLDYAFFGENIMNNLEQNVLSLTWKKCTVNDEFTQFANFQHQTGIPVTKIQYDNLKKCYEIAKKCLHEDGKTSMDLGKYFTTFKKTSRKNRKIICNRKHGFNLKYSPGLDKKFSTEQDEDILVQILQQFIGHRKQGSRVAL
jgi:hypothetical protein